MWKSAHTVVKDVIHLMLAAEDSEAREDLQQSLLPGAKECMDRFLPVMMDVLARPEILSPFVFP